jgi:hypothetical protein
MVNIWNLERSKHKVLLIAPLGNHYDSLSCLNKVLNCLTNSLIWISSLYILEVLVPTASCKSLWNLLNKSRNSGILRLCTSLRCFAFIITFPPQLGNSFVNRLISSTLLAGIHQHKFTRGPIKSSIFRSSISSTGWSPCSANFYTIDGNAHSFVRIFGLWIQLCPWSWTTTSALISILYPQSS